MKQHEINEIALEVVRILEARGLVGDGAAFDMRNMVDGLTSDVASVACQGPGGPVEGHGWTYIVGPRSASRSFVKIGSTGHDDVLERVWRIQCRSPVALEVLWLGHGKGLESILHRIFWRQRMHGEWFAAEPVLAWIRNQPSTCPECRDEVGELRKMAGRRSPGRSSHRMIKRARPGRGFRQASAKVGTEANGHVCSNCNAAGHNKRTCIAVDVPGTTPTG